MIRIEPKLDPADYAEVVLEDGAFVESDYHDAQRALLMDALYSSRDWLVPDQDRPFKAMSNVGIFREPKSTAICPDVLLSLDVAFSASEDARDRVKEAYFYTYALKAPEVVVEISSRTDGKEHDEKLLRYAELEIRYCIVFDPNLYRGTHRLRIFELTSGPIRELFHADGPGPWFVLNGVGIGATIWSGQWRGLDRSYWLRWCYPDGRLLPIESEMHRAAATDRDRQERMKLRERTAKLTERAAKDFERSEKERALAQANRERVEKERALDQAERERTEKEHAQQLIEALRAKMRALGIDPGNS